MRDPPPHRRVGWVDVVAAAAAVVRERGVAELTIDELGRRLETEPAQIAYWFTDPRDLLAAVMRLRQQQFLERVWANLATQPTHAAKLHRLLEICSTDHYAAYWIELWRFGLRDADARELRQEIADGYRELVARVVRAGVEAGEFEDVPVDVVALILVNLVAGLSVQATLNDARVTPDEMLASCVEASQALLGARLSP